MISAQRVPAHRLQNRLDSRSCLLALRGLKPHSGFISSGGDGNVPVTSVNETVDNERDRAICSQCLADWSVKGIVLVQLQHFVFAQDTAS